MTRLNKILLSALLITGILFLISLTVVIITDEIREDKKQRYEMELKKQKEERDKANRRRLR